MKPKHVNFCGQHKLDLIDVSFLKTEKRTKSCVDMEVGKVEGLGSEYVQKTFFKILQILIKMRRNTKKRVRIK